MHEFKHPNYYKELRKRNKLDQVISRGDSTEAGRRSPGPGLKVTSYKLPGPKPISNANKGLIHKRQAKRQASSIKPKRQASSKASSIKPAERQASSD